MSNIQDFKDKLSLLKTKLHFSDNLKSLEDLKIKSEDPELWQNPQSAQEILQNISDLQKNIQLVQDIELEIKSL